DDGTCQGELDLSGDEVESFTWTVHLANKKSVWYEFSEQEGNLLLGENNSYAKQGVDLRNTDIGSGNPASTERQKLIIDPGEETINVVDNQVTIGCDTGVSCDGFPKPSDFGASSDIQGHYFTKLGNLKTDSKGNLIVLGGHGKSWGLTDLAGYGGGDKWFDDISDGYVTCKIELNQGGSHTLKAWVIVGPPDFAPELTNISAWDDTAFDVAVRELGLVPQLYGESYSNDFNPEFKASYERDILPIINRISRYHWVANVQSMTAFSSNIFDFSDPSAANQEKRQEYFRYFRELEPQEVSGNGGPPSSAPSSQTTLFSSDKDNGDPNTFTYTGIPLMPLNSASNSVSEVSIKKFLALTETQYFFLQQWSEGKFYKEEERPAEGPNVIHEYPLSDKDRASIGNVVGLPQCPGIEVTWTTQNMNIYEEKKNCAIVADKLYQIRIKHAQSSDSLSTARDETDPKDQNYGDGGCEPGDLTKRMAVPWQADFYNCSIQLINYTDPDVNKDTFPDGQRIPRRPTYYTYWWPPQAPWDVINGLNVIVSKDDKGKEKAAKIQEDSYDAEMTGLQMNFARGINSYSQMVNGGWASLAFIRNKGESQEIGSTGIKSSELFPYFVETERNYDDFEYKKLSYEDGDAEVELVVTNFKPVEQQQNKRIALLKEKIQLVENVEKAMESTQQGSLTFANINAIIDEGGKLRNQISQLAGALQGKDIRQLKASLQKSLQDVESFRKINVVRKPGEIPRSGRRIRF
ncbi:MAG: hypothetical protein F6J92_02175, partial [Symploca sp. SIO1A3]|nr:hypothetical protein [Symploca sp. SIO1A3]